jgi:CubicO group peptidase (beta-lactamase class C family)
MRWWFALCSIVLAGLVVAAQSPSGAAADPTPQTLDGFKAAAAQVLAETGVPGAGIALVTVNGTEWAGGVGLADRDAGVPVTAETHFRAGSVSKSFVALALVQLYEEGKLDLDAEVATLLPELQIDNPWPTPITVRHLLEHTAGFDDMHFNETYVLDDAPDLPLERVLMRNPASRRARWRPGTRMSYANPGYAVAGRIVETLSGMPYDQYIQQKIFAPLEMWTSTFQLAPKDDAALARGYSGASGPPVPPRRIYLRPAGALHTSAGELAHFVQALLGWGERPGGYVVDPEYLSNMEWPRTTLANLAGVRSGYGMGIRSTVTLPYHVLGHNGGIEGFLSAYGYSPSRDVGFVVLLNSTHAPDALTRLSSLAIRYLKRDVEPPAKPVLAVPAERLRQYVGYYRDLSPRNAIEQPVRFLAAGHRVSLDGDQLMLDADFGARVPLVPVEDGLFRREAEIDATLAFTSDDTGRAVLTGPGFYAEQATKWPVTLLRAGIAASLALALVAPLIALGRWVRGRARRETPAGFGGLGWLWAAALALLGLGAWAVTGDVAALAVATSRSQALFGATLAYPAAAVAACLGAAWGWVRGPRRAYAVLAALTALAHAGLATYLGWWGLVGFRSWTY